LVPNEWYDKKYKDDNKLNPDYVNDAINGIIPEYNLKYKTDK